MYLTSVHPQECSATTFRSHRYRAASTSTWLGRRFNVSLPARSRKSPTACLLGKRRIAVHGPSELPSRLPRQLLWRPYARAEDRHSYTRYPKPFYALGIKPSLRVDFCFMRPAQFPAHSRYRHVRAPKITARGARAKVDANECRTFNHCLSRALKALRPAL